MSLPSLHKVSRDREYERELRLIERLERRQDALVRENEAERKARRSDDAPATTDLEELIETIHDLDSKVRKRMMFHSVEEQQRAIKESRRTNRPQHVLYDEYEEWEELHELRGLLKKRRRRQAQQAYESILVALPDEIKMIIIQSQATWMSVCNLIQTLCSVSREVCESIWPLIADALEIPAAKPSDVAWRTWIKEWCQKLNDPWGVDTEQTMVESLWRLHHAPFTRIDWDDDASENEFLFDDHHSSFLNFRDKDIPYWPNDRAWVAAAVQHDGRLLGIASDALCGDRDIVRVACIENPNAFRVASTALRTDVTFIRGFMFSTPDILNHISPLIEDPQLARLRDIIKDVRRQASDMKDWNDDHAGDEDAVNGFFVDALRLLPTGAIHISIRALNYRYAYFVSADGRFDRTY